MMNDFFKIARKLTIVSYLLILSSSAYALEKKYHVDRGMGASISFVNGGGLLMRDSGGTGWSMYTSQGVNAVSLYLTKNDASSLKKIATKAKLLSLELLKDGCDGYEVHEKIGSIYGRQQEYGKDKVNIYVDCKQNNVSVTLFYADVHTVNTVYLTNRTWQELEKVADDVLDLYALHTENDLKTSSSLFNGQNSNLDWELRWFFSDNNDVKCQVESNKKNINSKVTLDLVVSDNSEFKVKFNGFANNKLKIIDLKIHIDEKEYEADNKVMLSDSSTFTFNNKFFIFLYNHINTLKKFTFYAEFEGNKVKKYEFIDPSDFKSLALAYSAKIYCDELKKRTGVYGFMFVEAVQNKPLNDFITENSQYEKAGVVIMAVDPRKNAFESGLRLFDIVLGVDKEPTNFLHFNSNMKKNVTNEQTILSVLRGDKFIEVAIY
jgi:hypothetical protein